MFKTKDLKLFFRKNTTNLLLVIPIATVLLPTSLAYPLSVPILLVPPHLFYLALFTIAVFAAHLGLLKKHPETQPSTTKNTKTKKERGKTNLSKNTTQP